MNRNLLNLLKFDEDSFYYYLNLFFLSLLRSFSEMGRMGISFFISIVEVSDFFEVIS